MAAVQNDEESAVGRQVGDEVLVQNVAVDLAARLEVVRDDGVEEASGALAGGVADLTAWIGCQSIYCLMSRTVSSHRGRSSGRSCRCFGNCQYTLPPAAYSAKAYPGSETSQSIAARMLCLSNPKLTTSPASRRNRAQLVPIWEVGRLRITVIAQDHLTARIALVAAVGQEFSHVLDI